MVVKLSDQVGAWAWAGSLIAAVALMLRPLPQSVDHVLSMFSLADTIFHFGLFVFLRTLPHLTHWGRTHAFRVSLALVGLGFALEIAQGFTPYRTAAWSDAAANTVGVLAGTGVCRLLEIHWCRHNG